MPEICSHRGKLLGLRDGVLVPYRESESCSQFDSVLVVLVEEVVPPPRQSTRALRLHGVQKSSTQQIEPNPCLTGMLNGALSTMSCIGDIWYTVFRLDVISRPYPPFPIVLELHHFLIGFCFGVRWNGLKLVSCSLFSVSHAVMRRARRGIAWGRVWAICKRWSPQAHGCEVKRGMGVCLDGFCWIFATLGKVNQLINVIYAWKLGNDESKCNKCKLSCSNVVCRVLASENLSQTPAFQWDLDCQSFVETWDDLYNCLRFLGWMIVIL